MVCPSLSDGRVILPELTLRISITRYVSVENAQYSKKHNLVLEEPSYCSRKQENNRSQVFLAFYANL